MATLQKMSGSFSGQVGQFVKPENGHEMESSDLSKIEIKSDNPFELFKEWYKMAQDAGVIMPHAMNVATSDGRGRVSGRTLLMRKLVDDGFIFMTDKRSKKSFDIELCPRVALTFLWMYASDSQGIDAQQVRVEGTITELPFQQHPEIFENEPLFCMLRANICRQGEYVEWSELKEAHDKIYKQCVEEGIPDKLKEPPNHYVLYKVEPEMMDFYLATNSTIGDRVVFRRTDQPHLIPDRALKTHSSGDEPNGHDGIDDLERTFKNGLKIVTGTEQGVTEKALKEWCHYHVYA
ncbi:Hypothetical predicted protein [Cloeon dipterum]|uniref:pyridoxal 5'-phosphate synthase n=3 Tax=Cloeon dipterum TaxID=197152 RepID=A0A8S1CES2_9INSE|nr:Hypothetical predicted protein [Cloeon dipterum]